MPPITRADDLDDDADAPAAEEQVHWQQRLDWMEERRDGLGADKVRILSAAQVAEAEERLMAPKAPPGAPGSRNWTPLGPTVVGFGQAHDYPAVSGRVLGIEVGPGSTHAYVGVGDGGMWRWTRNAAVNPPIDRWEPQDDFILAPTAPAASVSPLSCGDLAVNFATPANPDGDTIFVGTGEAHLGAGTGGVGGYYFGVGVRVSPPVVPGNPRAWHVEPYLPVVVQQPETYRLVLDPDNAALAWAATQQGVFRRPVVNGAGVAWTQLPTGGANQLPAGPTTDIRITGDTANADKSIYVAVANNAVAANDGVWRSIDNGATFNQIAGLPHALPTVTGRISLALDESVRHTPVLYALCQNPAGTRHLFRFDQADGQFRSVQTTPTAGILHGPTPGANGKQDQGNYDLAIAVAPGNANTVFLSGSVVMSAPGARGEWELSAYRSTIQNPSGTTWRWGFTGGNQTDARAHRDATYIGRNIHGDGHCFAFGRNAAGTRIATDVWAGCDGGVFRSTTSGDNGTFTPVNTGLATVQLTYLDNHPTAESVVLAGCQDNGTVRTDGSEVWLENPKGDGGGSAISQTFPWLQYAQTFNNSLNVSANGGREWRAFGIPTSAGENISFYVQACSEPAAGGPPSGGPNPNRWLITGSQTRVWASPNWGNTWQTLPTGTAPPNANQDVLTDALGNTTGWVRAMVWPQTNRLYVATSRMVYRFDFGGANWAMTRLGSPPGLARIRDLAVANAATDDIYVSTNGGGTGDVWWRNPAGNWINTTNRTRFNAPAQAIECDPGAAMDVWVGTDVGVYHGVRQGTLPAETWAWTAAPLPSQGLPEAAVTDLQIQPGTRLLRVATHGRGAWELDLTAASNRDPDLYLRMNNADVGRRHVASRATTDPAVIGRDNQTAINIDWADSPDLLVRRGIATQPAPAYPGTNLRLRSPRMTGVNVRRWQRHVLRRGVNLGPHGADGDFGRDSEAAAREFQRRQGLLVWNGGWATDGIVGSQTWDATVGYPALDARIDQRAFALDVQADIIEGTNTLIGDATGVNRVFLRLHNRGSRAVPPARVRALLLVADQAALANLPAGWDARIRNADVSAWTGAVWRFADPANAYQSPVAPLTSREPQIVEWNVDFQALGFNAGDTVVLLAFLTTTAAVAPTDPADVLTNAEVRPRQLVEGERRVAARRVRLDPVAVIP